MRLAVLLALAACAAPPKKSDRPRDPPAPVLVVTDGRVSLRASAYVELHSTLANAARFDGAVVAELEPAKRAYMRASQEDLERVARELAACTDDRCATAALGSEGFAYSYERALPAFVAREWQARASVLWHAIEVAHASFDPTAEALFLRVAQELRIGWEAPAPIAFATDPPATGIVPLAIPARGRCIVRGSAVLDCMAVHAFLGLASPIHETLVRELGAKAGERAWQVLVVQTVAVVFDAWNSKHHSVYRQFAEAEESKAIEWLKLERKDADFISRYVALWRH